MTITSFSSAGIQNQIIPNFTSPVLINPPSFGSGGLGVAAADAKHSYAGYVDWEDASTHNIAGIGWLTGTVTVGSGSTLRISLRDLSTSTPLQPDGTVDQSVTIDPSTLSSNTFYESTLSSTRSTAHMDKLSVVFDYSVKGTDTSININRINSVAAYQNKNAGYTYTTDGSTWTGADNAQCNIVFISDDTPPKYGRFHGHPVAMSATNSHVFNNTSDPVAYALSYTPPVDMKAIGINIPGTIGSNSDFDACIWTPDSSTPVVSTSVDMSQSINGTVGQHFIPITPTTLTAGTEYLFGIKATAGINITIYSFDIYDAAYRALLNGGGTAVGSRTLSSGGTWSALSTTRIHTISVELSGVDTGGGGGGGGGLILNPGLNGGING